MNRNMKALAALLLAAALAACGGGGGSAGSTGTPPTGGNPGGTPVDPADPNALATARVADFALVTDKSAVNNTGADTAKVTVQAVDANRNVVPGATVTATSDQNSVFAPDSPTTDDKGTFTGTLSIGADKSDRDITVAVTINGITKRTTVHVGGGRLALSATPVSPQPGQAVTLTANLKDSGGNPIQGVTVTFNSTGAGISNRTATTTSNGDASIAITAPGAAGVYTITATGSGTLAPDLQLQVLAPGSAVPNAVIPAGAAPSLAAAPNVLSVNAPNSTTNKAVLRFLLLDANNNPVPNVRVRFLDLTTGLPAIGASLAAGANTLFTDPSGSVSTQYISGQNSSSTNGVKLRACYSATDLTTTDVDNCRASALGSKFVDTTLTVAGQALSVSIGDDNQLEADDTAGMYIKRFAVTVADSAGRAVANAPVDISLDLTHYAKGPFFGDPRLSLPIVQALGRTEASAPNGMDGTPDPLGPLSWCPNEDENRNGNVDATTAFRTLAVPTSTSENYNGSLDANGQPTLEPRKSDVLISYDNSTVTSTNADGVLVIKVTYSQRFATWLAYKIRVTTNVSGSQGMAERLFVTDALADDVDNGSFNTPPYGTGACRSPN
jgi:hypothetical protein